MRWALEISDIPPVPEISAMATKRSVISACRAFSWQPSVPKLRPCLLLRDICITREAHTRLACFDIYTFSSSIHDSRKDQEGKELATAFNSWHGSDHIDLNAAAEAGLTIAEVTGSNVVSVAENELMRILILIRNFLPEHKQIVEVDWNVAAIAYRAYDLEGKTVGTVGAGRIGKELLKRLKPFNCKLLYHDHMSIGPELENETRATWEKDLDSMLPKCDIIVINVPLSDKTRGLFSKERISKLKKGVLIVNNARDAIMDAQAVADASLSGHIGGYSGDVWFPQPAPKDHPWHHMPNHAMTPHISGTSIDAQIRYSAGIKDILDRYFRGEDFPAPNYIVKEGKRASQYL